MYDNDAQAGGTPGTDDELDAILGGDEPKSPSGTVVKVGEKSYDLSTAEGLSALQADVATAKLKAESVERGAHQGYTQTRQEMADLRREFTETLKALKDGLLVKEEPKFDPEDPQQVTARFSRIERALPDLARAITDLPAKLEQRITEAEKKRQAQEQFTSTVRDIAAKFPGVTPADLEEAVREAYTNPQKMMELIASSRAAKQTNKSEGADIELPPGHTPQTASRAQRALEKAAGDPTLAGKLGSQGIVDLAMEAGGLKT